MSDYEEMPPGTTLIRAIQAEKSPFYLWAGEALDNALDAEASRVTLKMTNESLVCKDNGIGVTRDRINAMVMISSHGEMQGTKLGRFGVGIKYKSIQHGKTLHIESISKDGKVTRDVEWDEMLTSGRWRYRPAFWKAVPEGTSTGTIVRISELIGKKPSKADVERTKTEIQRRYYPALENGKIIILNDELVEGVVQPMLRDRVEATLSFPEGRAAYVVGGMLVDPHVAKLRQVDVCVAYRVIKPESAFGCDGYGGIRSMYAKVILTGPWKLTKFKDDIAEDPYLEELEAAVESVLTPLLERCESASMFMKTKKLEQLLNEMVPEDQRMTRPVQKQKLGRVGDKSGEKKQNEVKDSTPSSSGPTKKKKPPRGILIEFAPDLHKTHGFGRSQTGKTTTRIQLASDNPTIAILREHRDLQIAATALYAIAMLLYEGGLQDIDPRWGDEPIGLRAWRLAGQQNMPKESAA